MSGRTQSTQGGNQGGADLLHDAEDVLFDLLEAVRSLLHPGSEGAGGGGDALAHGGAAILILEMGHPMARELLCADGCSQHSNHHPVPIVPAHWGLQQAKSSLEGVERDDGVLILLLFGP